MPRHCSAVGCKSRDTKEVRKSGISFHRLPKKGNPRRTTWIINSRRKGPEGKGQWDPQSGFIYFCSKHFTPDSFELSGVSGYRRLKDDAIPTIFELQLHERGTAGKCGTKRRGRPQNLDKHISVKNSTNNKASASRELFNSETVVQKVADDEGVRTSEDGKGEKIQGQPSSEAAQTPVETSLDDQPEPSSPQPSPRPPSPSRFMMRLPPPPGFYLPKEHNYAQLCPLVWRKRYDKAIDSLEKALRLLSAARRRENRLRHALLRLRENRLKNTLFRMRDGVKGKEGRGGRVSSWAAQKGQAAKADRGGSLEGLEETANEGATDDIDLLAEGWDGQAQTRSKVTVEEEEGCCFYCGRDPEGNKVMGYKEATVGPDEARPKRTQEVKRKVKVPKILKDQRSDNTRTDVPPVKQQSYYLYYCESAENEDTMQVLTMEVQPHELNSEEEDSLELQDNTETIQQLSLLQPQSEMHPQMNAVSEPIQYTATLQDTSASFQLQHVQVLQPHQGLLLPELATKEKDETEIEQGGGQQFYWVQERADDHILLMPVPAETRERNKVVVENVIETVQPQAILERFQVKAIEERDGLNVKCDSKVLAAPGWGNSQITLQANLRPTVVGGDVRERLKEHLEGFQLQLSSEFID
ncbi:THAP domain-containing protein 7 isoform X2 [Myxocyprinus asiaticus]|nr:THAP domain-containing protein 7 isoform X2 [Myxocyprinus asiaticus]